jgi:tRNA threonylcarbamoyladenosine biosynthesis protein TsaB
MEVFAGIYTEDLTPVGESAALVLEKEFFASLTSNFSIVFCGNGSLKIPVEFLGSTRIVSPAQHNVNHMITLAEQAFSHNEFADLAYAEPLYVKEFYSTKQ